MQLWCGENALPILFVLARIIPLYTLTDSGSRSREFCFVSYCLPFVFFSFFSASYRGYLHPRSDGSAGVFVEQRRKVDGARDNEGFAPTGLVLGKPQKPLTTARQLPTLPITQNGSQSPARRKRDTTESNNTEPRPSIKNLKIKKKNRDLKD